MQTTNTLTLKKPHGRDQSKPKAQSPEQCLVGKTVTLQTRSPSQITGQLMSFKGGWVVIVGTERRWMPDGSLSEPITTGTFTLDRSVVSYLLEVL